MIYSKMNVLMKTTFTMICFFVLFSCTQKTPTDLTLVSIIPLPVSVQATGSSFALSADTDIYVSKEHQSIAQYLAAQLNPATGLDITVKTEAPTSSSGHIYLSISPEEKDLGEEGYLLEISEDSLKLTANNPAGLFRGVQTIRQLLPAKIEMSTKQEGPWEIPTGTIRDKPQYAFRGAMLDVSRHFFGVEDVKQYIDMIAHYKMNVLHLHLSDDQGWRIEIKSWPNLTKHGGSTQVGGGKGGFYTQEQYKEIVQYAQDRFITIIPEIDMPGHTNAALSSYPELNCDGKAPELYTGIEVGFSSLCTSKEITYKFIEDVIKELAALTPGPYIHIGGDESHATKKEDYLPFIEKVQDIVQKYGKQPIGWEEAAQAKLKGNTVIQYWANPDHAKEAFAKNLQVIMSPAKKAYMDMQYDSTTALGLHWAAYIEVDSAYIWDMETIVEGAKKENILGIEAPLWTETILKMDDIEYMIFPRLPGYAEIGWSPASMRNWDSYKRRLGEHGARFKAMNINYYPSKLVDWSLAKEVK